MRSGGFKPLAKPGKVPKNKVTKQWLAFRRKWLKENPPAWNDHYDCGICGQPVHKSVVELDHIIKRSVSPAQRFDPLNIRPVHKYCNNSR